MRPVDEIEHVVKKMSFKAGPEMDKDLWSETSKARNEFHKTILAPSRRNIWRIIMKSPITKLATAAVVIIACVIGLSLWRTTGSGIALADVIARIEQVKAYRSQWNAKITGEDPNKPYSSETRGTDLISQEYGEVYKSKQLDPNGGESTDNEYYRSPDMKTMIIIWPKQKKYRRTEFDDVFAEEMRRTENDPHRLVKKILACKYESMGRATIDGIEVEGFQTTDPIG